MADIIVGAQWGDEGKGKIVDFISNKYDIVARYQGGANAGHTIKVGDKIFKLHQVPSGIIRGVECFIGNGVVLDPIELVKEIKELKEAGFDVSKIKIAGQAHLVLPENRVADTSSHSQGIGTTGRGIGPAYADKAARKGVTLHGLMQSVPVDFVYNGAFMEAVTYLYDFVVDGPNWINDQIEDKKKVLLEGAQGTLLDIDHGTYPFVTSSNATSGGACTGTGISPKHIKEVFGIVKAYTTRVGAGPFPTELLDKEGEDIRERGKEYGTTTGRPRRCGWLDLPALRYATRINGFTQLAVTKLDVLTGMERIRVCVDYTLQGEVVEYPADRLKYVKPVYKDFKGWSVASKKDKNFKEYIHFIETYLGVTATFLSTGAERNETSFLIRTKKVA